MARIRTIKPDAFSSHSLAAVAREVRWTFAGLWTYCDDEGRGRYDIRLIKAALYPLDDDVTLDVLSGDLDALAEVASICRYEARGRDYFHVPRWEHQKINRPTPSKLPACPLSHDDSGTNPESSVSPHGVITEDSLGERKGREGKGTSTRSVCVSENFPKFWATYPRKVDRGHAEKAFTKAIKDGADPATLITAATAFGGKVSNSDPKFVPHAATWLNGQRWLDEDATTPQPDDQGRIKLPPLPSSSPWGS